MSKSNKCDCGSKRYPHGARINKEGFLIKVNYCPNCGMSVGEITNTKVIYKNVENPVCDCGTLTAKWNKRVNLKKQTLTQLFKCNICGKMQSVDVPFTLQEEQPIKGKKNEKNEHKSVNSN